MSNERPAPAPATQYENFDQIAADVGDAGDAAVSVADMTWKARWMTTRALRQLRRDVPAGPAKVTQLGDGRYALEIRVAPESAISREGVFETLDAAARAAQAFSWETREQAGLTWYRVGNLQPSTPGSTFWKGCVRQTERGLLDCAELIQHEDGQYTMRRHVVVRPGEAYEVTAQRWNEQLVTDFAEACAIALTLPTFVAALCDRGATHGQSAQEIRA